MTCQAIAQPGSDGFTIPGIAETIPLMLPKHCYANAAIIATYYPELTYQEGILAKCIGGRLATSVRHAWNIGPAGEIIDTTPSEITTFGPGQEITNHYIPDDAAHDAERQAVAAQIGPCPRTLTSRRRSRPSLRSG